MSTRYLFVDGGYLRKVIEQMTEESFGAGVSIQIDYVQLGHGFRKCFYYDCVGPRRKDESETAYAARVVSQRSEFSRIRMLDGWHVTEGVMVGEGARARQKQVDIQIAVDMLSHAHRRNMDELDFVAGDQDFKPLIEALVRDGMYVRLIYDPKHASEALVEAADAQRKITLYNIAELWATEAFRKAFPLPHRVSYIGRNQSLMRELLETGLAPFGPVELWRAGDVFTIVYPDKLNVNHVMHWTHPRRDFLQRIFAYMEGETTWTRVGA